MNSMMSKIGKHADLAAAGGIVLIVAMLIIPLPPLLLVPVSFALTGGFWFGLS